MPKRARFFPICILILTLRPLLAQHRDASLRIEPPEIPVDIFYSGAQVRVSGVSRMGGNLFLLCTGEESTVELKEKKRIAGLLWVNGEDISFRNVPSFYQLASSGKLGPLPATQDLIRTGLGFPALEARIVAQAGNDREHRCFAELIKLKARDGLYSIREGGLELHPLSDDWKEFSSKFFFPPDAGPGTYRFRLISLIGGRTEMLAEEKISIRLAGTAAFIRLLSQDRGLIYGVFSVVIALIAGLFTGTIFNRRSRKLGR